MMARPVHCWLRLRRHRPAGLPWMGWRWVWQRCDRCGRDVTVGDTGRVKIP
jgi:hypothetical protein